MSYQYFIADVFTKEVFGGAQIAVLPNAGGLSDEQMASVARELNLSETVFVFPAQGGVNHRRLRIFSPRGEIDYAGHPIIATAYVLGHCGDIELADAVTTVTFEQNTGPIEINISAEDGKPTFVQFTSKVSSTIDYFVPPDEELAAALSLKVSEFDHKKFSPRLVSCGVPYLIVPVWNYDSVRNARFDFTAWNESTAPQIAAQEILLFSPKTPMADADFNLRLLGPNIGPQDDPPVGGVLPAFASYLCSFDSLAQGTYSYAIDRGDANSRRSVLHIEMDNKGAPLLPLRVGGEAVIFAEGSIFI
jgi:trans-2,3-dihydro-3-hydroxyanthranilate isomerase